ncbi:hypothetical protein PV390_12530 [Streptomyces sp. ME02-6991-2A]|uniref:hypothetical protein n=1 Tax=Streptomyces sp. ME02-6991-2A TaxID=3028677 RepID=UPI0010082EF6|nr:hypothetical protein [Streptomyces sp. ME02-6991-2A]MDX3375225.1 hypothetical protein [Streptomyces sp. ME02-6991-2A]
MASRRHQRLALATAATLLTLTTAVGCAGLDKALDCVRTADAVATSVGNLQRAVSSASEDITQASEALDDIDRELKNLDDTTDNADLSKAVDDLQAGVAGVRQSIESGDATPDITPVTNAATEIGKVCSP